MASIRNYYAEILYKLKELILIRQAKNGGMKFDQK